MLPEPDLTQPIACDVAIAGAGLAGLVAGAILARGGLTVAVADATPGVGARGGATPYRGYWIDAGHRDGADVGDLQVGWRFGQLAAVEAGVEVPLRLVEPSMIWSAQQWVARPSCMAWYWAPVERHGLEVRQLPALWFVGSTFESEAGPIDVAAHAGLEAARAVLHAEGRA